MDSEDIRRLLRFIDWVMELPEALEQLFRDEITAFQLENAMPFIDLWQRMAMEETLLQGLEVALDLKFGAEGLDLMPELRELRDHELLRKVLARVKAAESPAELRRVWTRKRRAKKAEPK